MYDKVLSNRITLRHCIDESHYGFVWSLALGDFNFNTYQEITSHHE